MAELTMAERGWPLFNSCVAGQRTASFLPTAGSSVFGVPAHERRDPTYNRSPPLARICDPYHTPKDLSLRSLDWWHRHRRPVSSLRSAFRRRPYVHVADPTACLVLSPVPALPPAPLHHAAHESLADPIIPSRHLCPQIVLVRLGDPHIREVAHAQVIVLRGDEHLIVHLG